jgi:cell division protein FtsB
MKQLRRARLVLVAALAGAVIVVAAEFPLSELLHQHAALALTQEQLATLASRNSSLSADVIALSSNSTVNAIAHEEYGLVQPGQSSYVILPAANSAAAKQGLSATAIPPQDLVASGPTAGTSAIPTGQTESPGFWSRFASHLEFWHWGH